MVKETMSEHKDSEVKTCLGPTAHQGRGKVLVFHQWVDSSTHLIWFVFKFMLTNCLLSTIQVALNRAGKEDTEVFSSS